MATQKTITRKPSANAVKASRTPKTEIDDLDLDLEGDADQDVKEPVVKSLAGQSFERNMSGTKKIFTDLFKLTVAKVIKYEGWDEQNEHPDEHPSKFSHWEHTHPFRTYDKKGSKITTSTPIGGHFHVVEWEGGEDGKTPIIKSVSGPMVMGKKRIKGKMVQVPVPANDYDDHTHDIEYIRSSEIIVQATNVEAAKVIAWEANKTAPIPGVQERG